MIEKHYKIPKLMLLMPVMSGCFLMIGDRSENCNQFTPTFNAAAMFCYDTHEMSQGMKDKEKTYHIKRVNLRVL